jgi:hypothetical protein
VPNTLLTLGQKLIGGGAKGLSTVGEEAARLRMLRAAGGQAPIVGLPQAPLQVGGAPFIPGPSSSLRDAAEAYMRGTGREYVPVQNYVPVDVPRATKIAQEFDVMKHTPTDPAVMRSYEAMAKETRDQYEQLKKLGIKFEPFPPPKEGVPDPYAATPRLAQKDFLENKHMYYYPSEQGFGSEASGQAAIDLAQQPLLKGSGVKIAGKEVPFNDLFRIVHDAFGHIKEGVGFRAAGEENAWRSHARMYSPQALPAMTAETRGQNSWVNYGPFAAQNKGASGLDTIYAPQKLGMLPDWVVNSGRMTPLGIAGGAVTLNNLGEPDGQR